MPSTETLLDTVQTPSNKWHYFSTWQSPVGRQLERLSIQIIEAFNYNIELTDYLKEHIHDSVLFISGLPGAEPVRACPEEQLRRMQKFFSKHPSWKVHATNPSSLVDEENGEATVFTTSTISGFMVDLARERVTRSSWRRIGGQWKMVEHSFLIGGGIPPDHQYASGGAPT
jgi:hypothetical protein